MFGKICENMDVVCVKLCLPDTNSRYNQMVLVSTWGFVCD